MGIRGHSGRGVEQRVTRQLHVCEGCGSGLVYPMDWEETGPERWSVTLRCPNCEWTRQGVFSQDEVDPFDEELDNGTQALIRDLRELTRANMAEDIDRFVAGLEADAILPMDF
jgi:hypothetical protein